MGLAGPPPIRRQTSTIQKMSNTPPCKDTTTNLNIDKREEVQSDCSRSPMGEVGRATFNGVMEDVSESYNIGKELGYGKYGIVRLVSKKSYDKKRFALKTISRTLMLSKDCEADSTPLLENEFEILKQVDHPNIIKFYQMFVDEKNYHLVTEFCGGGELFDHIIERGKFSE